MTREEIERLDGRSLDAVVEERVFGRDVAFVIRGGRSILVSRGLGGLEWYVPGYSDHMGWAWEVVEAMRQKGYYPEVRYVSREGSQKVWVIFHDGDHHCGYPCIANGVEDEPEFVARAICRAALIALANEEDADRAE